MIVFFLEVHTSQKGVVVLTRKQIQKAAKHKEQYGGRPSTRPIKIKNKKSRRQDPDLKTKTSAQLRREVMRLRTAFRKELSDTGNRRCWITLLQTLPERKIIDPLSLSKEEFLANCAQYHTRNQ
jgi:hypothetical protein